MRRRPRSVLALGSFAVGATAVAVLLASVLVTACEPTRRRLRQGGPAEDRGVPVDPRGAGRPGQRRRATARPTCARRPWSCGSHGGGYQIGDKAGKGTANKVKLFNSKGWVFVSVNYRLTVAGDPDSANFPDHYEDVAAAIDWVHRSIRPYGGDPDRIALLGHSAGADIVSNVAGQPERTSAGEGLPLSTIDCAGPLDTEGFDKVASTVGEESVQWETALGDNPNYLTETSATRFLTVVDRRARHDRRLPGHGPAPADREGLRGEGGDDRGEDGADRRPGADPRGGQHPHRRGGRPGDDAAAPVLPDDLLPLTRPCV